MFMNMLNTMNWCTLFVLLVSIHFVINASVPRVKCDPMRAQIPHPTDNRFFYKCTAAGQPVLYKCPQGTIFDKKLEVCNWENKATVGVKDGSLKIAEENDDYDKDHTIKNMNCKKMNGGPKGCTTYKCNEGRQLLIVRKDFFFIELKQEAPKTIIMKSREKTQVASTIKSTTQKPNAAPSNVITEQNPQAASAVKNTKETPEPALPTAST